MQLNADELLEFFRSPAGGTTVFHHDLNGMYELFDTSLIHVSDLQMAVNVAKSLEDSASQIRIPY